MFKNIKSDTFLYKVLPISILFILLVFSQLFYIERVVFLDNTFKLFEAIRTDGFAIQAQRFPMVVTQFFPWLAFHNGWDMEWVIRMYSASYIVWFSVVYFISGFVLRQWKVALTMPLFAILMCTQTFYWATNELHQGIGFLVLQISLIEFFIQNPSKRWITILIVLNTVNILYIHPLTIYVYMSVIGYYLLFRNENRKWYIYAIVLTIVMYVCKQLFLPIAVYDQGANSRLKSFIEIFPNYFTQASQLTMIKRLPDDYLIWALLFLFTLSFLVVKKQWLRAAYYFIISVAYAGLITISFYDSVFQFYLEALLLPVSLYTAFVITLEVFDGIGVKKSVMMLAAVSVIRLGQIYHEHIPFTDRLNWMREHMAFTAAMASPKVMTTQQKVPMDKLVMAWAAPYEFWVLSALDFPDKPHRQLLIVDNPDNYRYELHNKKKFVTTWGAYPFEELPAKYFNFTDTTNAYIEY